MSQPSPEAMQAAEAIFNMLESRGHALSTSSDELYDVIDDAFRPLLDLRESHERLRVACEAFVTAWEKSHQLEKTEVAIRLGRSALAQVPR